MLQVYLRDAVDIVQVRDIYWISVGYACFIYEEEKVDK
jgi:hypothetical protein